MLQVYNYDKYDYEVGTPWKHELLQADFTFSILKDSAAYEEMSCYTIYKVITLCPGAQPSIAIFAKTANLNRIVKDLGGAILRGLFS